VPALPRPRRTVALSDAAIRPSVAPGLGAQLQLPCGPAELRGLRIRPRTDVDPPRDHLGGVGGGRMVSARDHLSHIVLVLSWMQQCVCVCGVSSKPHRPRATCLADALLRGCGGGFSDRCQGNAGCYVCTPAASILAISTAADTQPTTLN